MWLITVVVLAGVMLAGCASSPGSPTPVPATRRGDEFGPTQLRQAAVLVRVALAPASFSDRERGSIPREYEAALLDALDAHALVTKDVRLLASGERFDVRAAATRAREVGADHALLVDVRASRAEVAFCTQTRRPFRAVTTLWTQTATVVRATDGTTRLEIGPPGVQLGEMEPDCGDPRASRPRPRNEVLGQAADLLLRRLLTP